MTQEKQREALAARFPTLIKRPLGTTHFNFYHSVLGRNLPCLNGDPLQDLNAMWSLVDAQPIEIRKALRSEVWRLSSQMEPLPRAAVFAEALLRTLGDWTND